MQDVVEFNSYGHRDSYAEVASNALTAFEQCMKSNTTAIDSTHRVQSIANAT
jgi:hypothetical protein